MFGRKRSKECRGGEFNQELGLVVLFNSMVICPGPLGLQALP